MNKLSSSIKSQISIKRNSITPNGLRSNIDEDINELSNNQTTSKNSLSVKSSSIITESLKRNNEEPKINKSISENFDNESIDYKYSWCCIKPNFCKLCENWIYIFVILNVCVFIQNLVTSGIGTVIISTMEKEFYLTSTESGLFLGIYDLAAFLSSPIIGFFGGLKNSNKMRIISISLLLVTLGSYIIGLTVFMKEPDISIYTTDSIELSVCLINSNKTINEIECSSINLNKSNLISKNIKVILYFANIIIGCGSVALYSIGIAYIEEIVNVEKSSLCQAIFYGIGAIGGGVGILATGQFLNFNSRFYLDSFKNNNNLTTKSANWIGCWWMPWLIYGFLCNIIAIYVYGFPKKIKNNSDSNNNNEKQTNQVIKTKSQCKLDEFISKRNEKFSKIQKIKQWYKNKKLGLNKFFKDLKSIISNLPFICLTLASATEGVLLKGFLGFISKFFEFQYQISSTNSTIITGVIAIFSVIVGSLSGALIISKLKFTPAKNSLLVSIIYLITSFSFWFLTLSCEEDQFVNSTVNQTCKNCDCSNIYNPVCYSYNSKLYMYQSACHAGCINKISSDLYSNCSCVSKHRKFNETLSFSNCDKNIKCVGIMITGCCVAFFIVFLTSVALIPHLKAILGNIDIRKQPFALGIRTAIIRVIGNFIGPIIFGYAMDTTCLFWKTNCFDQKVCKIYSNKQMSLLLASIGFFCRFSSCILCFIAFSILKYNEKKSEENQDNKNDKKEQNQIRNIIEIKAVEDDTIYNGINLSPIEFNNNNNSIRMHSISSVIPLIDVK